MSKLAKVIQFLMVLVACVSILSVSVVVLTTEPTAKTPEQEMRLMDFYRDHKLYETN